MSLIIPANTLASGGYAVDNSLRFNGGSSDSLNRTLGTPTNNKKYTISTWVKKTKNSGNVNGNSQSLMGTIGGDDTYFEFNGSTDQLFFGEYSSSAWQIEIKTNRVFRDNSAWYHIVVAVDTTQGTEGNRVKLYVNGVQETSLAQTNYPSEDFNTKLNSASNHYISNNGNIGGDYAAYLEGYLSEYFFIDGLQLAPTDFGEFDEDSGIWKPIDVSGLTFGDNGFYLDFENSGALGADVSGESNNFTVNNLTAIDQSTDTCTNNFATWNPLVHYSTSATFSEGNLKVAPTENTSTVYTVSTIGMPTVSGSKWYAEFKYLETNDVAIIGILDAAQISYVFRNNSDLDNQNGDTSVGRVTYRSGNGLIKFPSGQSVDSSVTLTNNDIVMIALDSGSGKIWFGVNGTWFNSGNPATGSNGVDFTGQSWWTAGVDDFVFFVGDGNTGGHDDWEANFGSPSYAISSGNTDGNGYGNFEYAVPSGYFSLNTKNLAEYG